MMTTAQFSMTPYPPRFHRRRWAKYVRRTLARAGIGQTVGVLGYAVERLTANEWALAGSPIYPALSLAQMTAVVLD